MSILIKGMAMPISCWSCRFFHSSLHYIGDDELLERYTCLRTGERTEEIINGRMDNCPLVHVPPHGDLIDRDELSKSLNRLCDRVCQYSKQQRHTMCGCCPLGHAFAVVEDDAPPIIEAEEGE